MVVLDSSDDDVEAAVDYTDQTQEIDLGDDFSLKRKSGYFSPSETEVSQSESNENFHTPSDNALVPSKRMKSIETRKIMLKTETQKLRRELAKEAKRYKVLESTLERTNKHNALLQEQVLRCRQEMASLDRKRDHELSEMIKEKHEIEQKFEDYKAKTTRKVSSLSSQLEQCQEDQERAVQHSETLSQRNTELAGKITELRLKLGSFQDLQEKLGRSERKISDIERLTGNRTFDVESVLEIRSKVKHLEDTLLLKDREIGRLETRCEIIPNLKEDLGALKAQLDRKQTVIDDLLKFQVDSKELLSNGDEWARLCSKVLEADIKTPSDLVGSILAFKNQVVDIEKEKNELWLKNVELSNENDMCNKTQLDQKAEITYLSAELHDIKSSISLNEQKIEILQAQKDSLDRIVKSYEDETVQISTDDTTMNLKSHCESLEASVRAKDAMLRDLETKLEAMDQIESQKNILAKKLDKAMNEVQILKSRLGRGEFNTTMTRILHLGKSPKELSPSSVDTKKSLEEQLKIKNKEVGQCEKRIEVLKKETDSLRIAKERLVEVYRKVTQDFKDVYYELSGFALDLIGKRKYRLKSRHSEHDSDALVFHVPKHTKTPFILPNECILNGPVLALHFRKIVDENNRDPIGISLSRLSLALYEKQ